MTIKRAALLLIFMLFISITLLINLGLAPHQSTQTITVPSTKKTLNQNVLIKKTIQTNVHNDNVEKFISQSDVGIISETPPIDLFDEIDGTHPLIEPMIPGVVIEDKLAA